MRNRIRPRWCNGIPQLRNRSAVQDCGMSSTRPDWDGGTMWFNTVENRGSFEQEIEPESQTSDQKNHGEQKHQASPWAC
jgi:hypothetical protein